MLDIDTFRALCKRVVRKNPSKLEILKERMGTLPANRELEAAHHSNVFVN